MVDSTAPLRVDALVYAQIYNIKTGHYENVHALVKGKSRAVAVESGEPPWRLVVELRCDVGTSYLAEDVVGLSPAMVSRVPSGAVMPTQSDLAEGDLAGLPEVRVRHYRIVGAGS